MALDAAQLALSSDGRFLVVAVHRGSRLKSWSGFKIFDLEAKKFIFEKRVEAYGELGIAAGKGDCANPTGFRAR